MWTSSKSALFLPAFLFVSAVLFLGLRLLGESTFAAEQDQKEHPVVNTNPIDEKQPAGARVERTDAEWKRLLTHQQYHVTREKGTERAFSGDLWNNHEEGTYRCVCCGAPLFTSDTKFESGTGWPSFFQPVDERIVAEHEDNSYQMRRIEVTCSRCDAHLGHVFDDGPAPTGLRYCINSAALTFQKGEESPPPATPITAIATENDSMTVENNAPAATTPKLQTATFGSGCFWCTEAVFDRLKGVHSVVSGYTGGHLKNPTYEQVCSGTTGHAEVIQVTFDPAQISYDQLLKVFWYTHDPTTLNKQGADVGTQYRSAVFYHNDEQKNLAEYYKAQLDKSGAYGKPIVTEIVPMKAFYPAEKYHQDYYDLNPSQQYCSYVIRPKVEKFEQAFGDLIEPAPSARP